MVIKVGDKWCKATTTWKFWWNFLAKSLFFSRYPSFSPFECPDAYKCYTFSESYGSRETREIKISTSKFDLEAQGILSPLWTQTGPWSDTASYGNVLSAGTISKCGSGGRSELHLHPIQQGWINFQEVHYHDHDVQGWEGQGRQYQCKSDSCANVCQVPTHISYS